ncbi:tetratricopeptide repeat protein [Lysobacter humi (ex Lee et al. 2017)]
MRRSLDIALFLLLALAASLAAHAGEGLPVHLPEGAYREGDPAAMAIHPGPGQKAKYREYLSAVLRQNPRNVAARVARAYQLKNAGALDRAREDLDRAAADATPGSEQARHVLWSRGWVAYDLGDYPAALVDWRAAIAAHGGRPFWAPYTLALLYWTTGDRETALAWYQAAVETIPAWGNDEGFADRVDHWRPAQRATMEAVYAAWKARRSAAAN